MPNNRLEYTRKKRGITQKQLAELVGKSPQYICDIENGRRNIDSIETATVLKMAKYLKTSPEFILGWDWTAYEYNRVTPYGSTTTEKICLRDDLSLIRYFQILTKHEIEAGPEDEEEAYYILDTNGNQTGEYFHITNQRTILPPEDL